MKDIIFLGLPLVEWLGYLASILVAVSLLMNKMERLRWLNLAGCLMFFWYAMLISAIPVAIVNAFIALTNMYYLQKLLREKKNGDRNTS